MRRHPLLIRIIVMISALTIMLQSTSCAFSSEDPSKEGISEEASDGLTAETSSEENAGDITRSAEETSFEIGDADSDWLNAPVGSVEYAYVAEGWNEPWFFSWEFGSYPKYSEVRESYPFTKASERYALRVPLRYEIRQDGLIFRFEFFREYYPLRSIMQVRATVINDTGEEIYLVEQCHGNDGMKFYHPETGSSSIPYQGSDAFRAYDKCGDYVYFYQNGAMDDQLGVALSSGESFAFERLLMPLFEVGDTIPIAVSFTLMIRYPSDLPQKTVSVLVPIEFVMGEFTLDLPEDSYTLK